MLSCVEKMGKLVLVNNYGVLNGGSIYIWRSCRAFGMRKMLEGNEMAITNVEEGSLVVLLLILTLMIMILMIKARRISERGRRIAFSHVEWLCISLSVSVCM